MSLFKTALACCIVAAGFLERSWRTQSLMPMNFHDSTMHYHKQELTQAHGIL